MYPKICFRFILALAIIACIVSMGSGMSETAQPESIMIQAKKSSDISGNWKSSNGLSLQITQQGNSFSWTDTTTNSPATGNIQGENLTAVWIFRRTRQSITGKITEYDSAGRPIKIVWSNQITFSRPAATQIVTPAKGWCCKDTDVFMATASQCQSQGGRFFKTREEAEAFCREEKPQEGWCCKDGDVFWATAAQCNQQGGRFFRTREEAEAFCLEKEPEPESGFCCLDGRIFPSSIAECRERGGRFFGTMEEAEEHCRGDQPREGWCCLDGDVFPTTEPRCLESGGRFFFTREEAEEFCRGEHPGEGWCCLEGEVFPAREDVCLEKGGRFFHSREAAEEFCREMRPERERGYCCLDGKIFPSSPEECEERGGRFFPTQEEAEEFCRGEHPGEGWCCLEGEVFPAREDVCLEKGGRFFHSREAAEEFCRGDRPEPEQGFCCLKGKIYPATAACCEEFGGRFFRTREEAEEFCRGDSDELTIPDLKGPNWAEYVGQTITVEGIFARDPLPMLVTDLDIVRINRKMPDDRYIILLGANAREIDPDKFGGAKLRLTGIVNAVDDAQRYALEYVGITVISYEMIDRLRPYAPKPIPMKIPAEPKIAQENRYAILFGGGISNANNHHRYWNDLKFMYSTLISEYGYTSSTIAVLYANGKAEDSDMPVHYAGTQTNLEKVFDLLKGITTNQDLIFVFMTNHGGGFDKDDIASPLTSSGTYCGRLDTNGDEGTESLDEKKYNQDFNGDGKISAKVSWDEELCAWQESIYDDDLTPMLTGLKFDRMVIVMEQCYSGGLIPDMAGINRIIMSAAGEFETSKCMDSFLYDEFSYYFTCAINGADPDGKSVDADTNNDGEVSMVEAFNYAQSKDTQDETPWYEDSGDGIPHSGNMPKGGDGSLGNTTTLE